MNLTRIVISVAISFLIIGCEKNTENETKQEANQEQANTQAMPTDHPAIQPGPATASQQQVNEGVVRQAFVGGGYTYAQVEAAGQLIWLAGPAVRLEKGTKVGWRDAAMMQNFNSKTLGRTFDQIYFISGFIQDNQSGNTAGVVEEAIPSAGYVYLKVKTDTSSVWLAVPQVEVKLGETVSWQGGAVMRNFQSNSLDRVFEQIIFVDKVTKGS